MRKCMWKGYGVYGVYGVVTRMGGFVWRFVRGVCMGRGII